MKPAAVRRVVSVAILILFIAGIVLHFRFLGSATNFVEQLQFMPSLDKLLHAGVLSFAIILIPVLTILFGRIYCSSICPLGTVMDCIGGIRRKKYKSSTSNLFFRYTIPLISIILFFAGTPILINFTDPYSFMIRFIEGITRFDFLLLTAVSVIWFLFIIITVKIKGRIYCNSICPVGAILSLITYFSLFSVKFNKSRCNSCGRCEKVCKAQCISSKLKSLDKTRCVSCLNCLSVCDLKALNYGVNIKSNVQVKGNRRSFIGLAVAGGLTYPLTKLFALKFHSAPVTPPGSGGLAQFLKSCTACQRCVSVCPTKVLKPALFEYGLSGFFQPYLDFKVSSCDYNCNHCTKTCPTGALKKLTLDEKRKISLGEADINENLCVVYTKNTACAACYEICPTGAVYMIDYKNGIPAPKMKQDICIGCGACQFSCPTNPVKAIMVTPRWIHKTIAKLPEASKRNDSDSNIDQFAF